MIFQVGGLAYKLGATSQVSWPINIPAGTASGDWMVLAISVDNAELISSVTGWTLLYTRTQNYGSLSMYYRISNGSDPAVISLTASKKLVYSIRTFRNVADIAATGSIVTNYDPPNIAPGWGSVRMAVVGAVAWQNGTASGAPANYLDLHAVNADYTVQGVATAYRIVKATAENPGAFTSAFASKVAATIALRERSSAVHRLRRAHAEMRGMRA